MYLTKTKRKINKKNYINIFKRNEKKNTNTTKLLKMKMENIYIKKKNIQNINKPKVISQ